MSTVMAAHHARGVDAGAVQATRAIRRLGAAGFVVYATYASLSWGMAVIAPPGSQEPLEAAWYDALGQRIGGGIGAFVRGDSILADTTVFVAAYATLLLVASAVFVLLLAALARDRTSLGAAHVREVFAWAVGFAAVLVFAVPVLVQDFWLSAGWGRLVASGVNPYYVYLDPDVTRGLPLDYLGLLTTYGPLWTLLCGAVMLGAGTSGIAAGLLFKAVLGAAWLGSLLLVRSLMREQPAWQQCVALAIAGWLPVTLIHIMADGHNDIAMVVLVLLWLWLLERARPLPATAALAASVVMKYLSAPLLVVDLLHHVRSRHGRVRAYVPRALLAAAIGIGALVVFYRSPAFFAATAHMTEWHFFTPRDGVVALARIVGIEPGLDSLMGMAAAGMAVLLQLAFIGLGVFGVLRYAHDPEQATLRYAVFAVAAAMLFGVAGHLWPWFLTWAILLGALRPDSALCRWTVGVALALPFALLIWVMHPGLRTLMYVTPPMYVFAVVWLVIARRWIGRAHVAVVDSRLPAME